MSASPTGPPGPAGERAGQPAGERAGEPAGERAARRATAVRSVSVGLATGAYGVSFGALAVASGLSTAQALALSALMFTGGSQFALVGVVAAGGSGAAATASAALLGARNGLYGLQVAPMLGVRGVRRLLAAHLTIDESTAVGSGQPTPSLQRLGFWLTGAAVLVLWTATTLLGAVLGDALGDPRRYGLDAAAAAAFLGLLWPRLRDRSTGAVAAAAAVVATVCVPVLPPGAPVLLAVLVVLPAVVPRRPRRPRRPRPGAGRPALDPPQVPR